MRRNKTTYSLLQTILVACLLTVTPTFASNKPTTDESGEYFDFKIFKMTGSLFLNELEKNSKNY